LRGTFEECIAPKLLAVFFCDKNVVPLGEGVPLE